MTTSAWVCDPGRGLPATHRRDRQVARREIEQLAAALVITQRRRQVCEGPDGLVRAGWPGRPSSRRRYASEVLPPEIPDGTRPVRRIAEPSASSLYIETRANGNKLGNATAFTVVHEGKPYLVTNWHVVTGRHRETLADLNDTPFHPEDIVVWNHLGGNIGTFSTRDVVRLRDDDDRPLWLEHPRFGRRVDVVAIPFDLPAHIEFHPYSLDDRPAVPLTIASQVSIVGFPFGLTSASGLGIWVQGTVATEPELDFDELPCFLVDCRTTRGQSGSPVIFHSSTGVVPMKGGQQMYPGSVTKLWGVYSSRVNDEADLGHVWRASALVEIFQAQKRGQAP